MGKFQLFCLVLTTLYFSVSASNLLLDPPFPPTAFLGQKYNVRFQVYGLVKPTFSYSGLPSFLTGHSNGSLIGTPQAVGSFKVNISYSDKTRKGSDEVIICIQSNTSDNINLDSNEQNLKGNLYIDSSSNLWIYRAGEPIQIEFNFINVVEPMVTSYKNLPQGLIGDSSTVSGSVMDAGVYTFSVTIGDSNGYMDQAYFTINIQPNPTQTNYSEPLSNVIVDVPVKNVEYSYNANIMEISQSSTRTATKNAFSKLIDATNNEITMKNALLNSQNALALAQRSQSSTQQSYQTIQHKMNVIQNYLNEVSLAIAASKMQISLINTSLVQYNSALKDAKQRLKLAEEILVNCSIVLNQSAIARENILKEADVQKNASVSSANAISARNYFEQSANNLEIMKETLNKAQRQLDYAKLVVQNSQLNVDLATSDNDVASSNLKIADKNIKIAAQNTQNIKKFIENVRPELQNAKTNVGIAKYNMAMAENRLYVAQAAKGAADRALAILVAQGNNQVTSLSVEYQFKGCENYAYPSMFGSVRITSFITNGVKTSSGQILVWGDCTRKQKVNVGDLIYYEGSLVKESISVWLIRKLSN